MTTELTTGERQDRQFGRALRVGIVVSLLLHVVIVLLFRDTRVPPVDSAAAGPDANDALAAAGGAVETINLRVTEPQPIPRPPEPLFVPEIQVTVQPEPQQEVEPVDLSALSPGFGEPAETPGAGEDATGEGDAGNSPAGQSRTMPPNPQSLIIPPTRDVPRSVRGRDITVYVFVDQRGRVVSDSTRVIPPSGDRRFDREVVGRANEWIFDPARREGRAVSAWFMYTWRTDG